MSGSGKIDSSVKLGNMIQKTQFKAGSMLAIIRLRRYEEQDTSSNVFLSWVYTLCIYMFIYILNIFCVSTNIAM